MDDPKVQAMREDVITNSIDTPWGYKNPESGISFRCPLSQLFSAVYLKPLDDVICEIDEIYARYQDDIIVLYRSKRQMNHCRRRMMEVLHERKLILSRKKSRMESIEKGFHYLGIDWPRTQPHPNTKAVNSVDTGEIKSTINVLCFMGTWVTKRQSLLIDSTGWLVGKNSQTRGVNGLWNGATISICTVR